VAATRSVTAEFLLRHYSDAIAVEIEGRGFLEAVNINTLVLGGVVRGISDLLSGKSEADESGSQPLAADAASAAVFEILHGLPPTSRTRRRKLAKKAPAKATRSHRGQPSKHAAPSQVSAGTPAAPAFWKRLRHSMRQRTSLRARFSQKSASRTPIRSCSPTAIPLTPTFGLSR
jgi:hypothetical protein